MNFVQVLELAKLQPAVIAVHLLLKVLCASVKLVMIFSTIKHVLVCIHTLLRMFLIYR
jgi:hypothetical protein